MLVVMRTTCRRTCHRLPHLHLLLLVVVVVAGVVAAAMIAAGIVVAAVAVGPVADVSDGRSKGSVKQKQKTRVKCCGLVYV